ncbi:MAG: aminotransferase class I/II-fold pyridoxal phosphate-dependent enzyme [Candidatus Gastranaerophilales bacterium]|nr:aminotransferase class I/II-fold pyridoxal phosphate-dependent enzyme [Candidatus Gastranaerophilales bacterium]
MNIISAIRRLASKNPTLFTTPGHGQGYFTTKSFGKLFGRRVFYGDFSEVEGMDNLQHPSGAILYSMQRAAKIYGAQSTFYLVNGSSSGIIALILATVKRGEKILIARNAHKSVINALILSGAHPVWIETDWDDKWNIPTGVNLQKVAEILDKQPDIKAFLLTSPTYEGIVTDLKPIADLCHQRGVVLLVDEAHGALWNFSDCLPTSSIHCGADACVHSLHKTGSCLNQGALLHIAQDSLIFSAQVQSALNLINTTSPSYLLLSSIEASIEYLNSSRGRQRLESLITNIEQAKEYLSQRVEVEFLESNHDPTKLFFGLKNISGQDLSDFLEEKHNIEVELNNNVGILALTGIGTGKDKLEKLANAVIKANKKLKAKPIQRERPMPLLIPQVALTPNEAFYAEHERLPIEKAVGRIAGETVIKYPPGIPLLIAGEIVQEGHLQVLKEQNEIKVVL